MTTCPKCGAAPEPAGKFSFDAWECGSFAAPDGHVVEVNCCLRLQVAALRARAEAAEAAMEWRPIETAPGCGVVVLLCAPSYSRRVVEAHRSINGKWWTMNGNHVQYPTHWLPLPSPPEAESKGE